MVRRIPQKNKCHTENKTIFSPGWRKCTFCICFICRITDSGTDILSSIPVKKWNKETNKDKRACKKQLKDEMAAQIANLASYEVCIVHFVHISCRAFNSWSMLNFSFVYLAMSSPFITFQNSMIQELPCACGGGWSYSSSSLWNFFGFTK